MKDGKVDVEVLQAITFDPTHTAITKSRNVSVRPSRTV